MKGEIKTFEPIGEFNQVSDLINIREAIEKGKQITNVEVDTEKLIEEINAKRDNYFGQFQSLLEYISTLWGKYVNITLSYKLKDEWITEKEYNVLLTDFVPTNDCLFGIYSELKNPYNASVHYTCINLRDTIEKYRITFKEITKEQFLEEANKSIEDCLKDRLDKINGEDYDLTLHGYKSKTNTLTFDYQSLYKL